MISNIMNEAKKYAEQKAQAESFANFDLVLIARKETIEYVKERYAGFESAKNDYRFPSHYDPNIDKGDYYNRELSYVKPIFEVAIEKGVVSEDEWNLWERVHNLYELYDTEELVDCEVMLENYANYQLSTLEEK